jgi:hypothetical protein
MGLVGYYRRFIIGFSNIYHPITSLQKNGNNFKRTTKCEENFNLLKELLTSEPILNISNLNDHFVVCTNASKVGLGRFVTQNGHFISYESKSLKYNGRNYATHDLDLVAYVDALSHRKYI